MAETNWIDTIVVIIVAGFGLFILYKPLKEPIDRFFALIARLFKSIAGTIANKTSDTKESAEELIIKYG